MCDEQSTYAGLTCYVWQIGHLATSLNACVGGKELSSRQEPSQEGPREIHHRERRKHKGILEPPSVGGWLRWRCQRSVGGAWAPSARRAPGARRKRKSSVALADGAFRVDSVVRREWGSKKNRQLDGTKVPWKRPGAGTLFSRFVTGHDFSRADIVSQRGRL